MQILFLSIIASFVLTNAVTCRSLEDRMLHSRHFRRRQNCVLLSRKYRSSRLEQTWLDNAHRWADDFCSHMGTFSKETRKWLETIAALEERDVSASMDQDVFSAFVSTYDCNGEIIKKRTWIEPLSHGLRHPLALCRGGAADVDRNYLMLASRDDFLSPDLVVRGDSVKRPPQNIFIDLGASTWNAGGGGPSQSWFYSMYKRHGLEFDRLLLWEAQATPAKEIFSELPKDLWHKYQYFNWPASSNSSDPSSPLNIIKTIALPEDFVVLKLDIDMPEVEMAIIRRILDDPELLELVDEFFFEYHVMFSEMNLAWYGATKPSPAPTSDTLADSYELFRALREKGLRAHSWV